jgi:hypothetical protein
MPVTVMSIAICQKHFLDVGAFDLKNPGEGGTIPRAGDFPASVI